MLNLVKDLFRWVIFFLFYCGNMINYIYFLTVKPILFSLAKLHLVVIYLFMSCSIQSYILLWSFAFICITYWSLVFWLGLWINISVMLTSNNDLGNIPSSIFLAVCIELILFLAKWLVELTSEAVWTWKIYQQIQFLLQIQRLSSDAFLLVVLS